MNWRLPSNPILNRNNGCIAAPESPEYSQMLQNFCEEYRGKDEPKRNVHSPNICKEITVDEKLKLMERLKISGKPVDTFQVPAPQLNPEALSLVADLLKKATPQEQEALEKAFGAKDNTPELHPYTFISPEAIGVLEQVLQKAGITDNDAAIRFILSIGQIIMSISNSNGRASPRPRLSAGEREIRKHALRSPPVRSPNFGMPKHGDHAVACHLCNKSSLNNELQNMSDKKYVEKTREHRSYLQDVPRLPKIGAPKRSMLARQKPWHNLPCYPPQGKVENKLATFVLPHRPIPRSFTIHPEWD